MDEIKLMKTQLVFDRCHVVGNESIINHSYSVLIVLLYSSYTALNSQIDTSSKISIGPSF